jgi:hypothetical protein
MSVVDDVKEQAGELAGQAKPWITRLARLGIASKGVVYLFLAFLTAQAARGLTSDNVDIDGALLEISGLPYGRPVLLVIAVGLLGYVIWRFSQAIWDPTCSVPGFKGWKRRLLFTVNALAYSVITLTALQFLATPNPVSNDTPRDLATRLLAWTAGRILVGLVGVVLMGIGVSHLTNVVKARFKKELDTRKGNHQVRRGVVWLGRIGSAARGVVYGTVGFLLLQAAIYQIPYRAGGIGEAIRAIAFSTYGPLLLGAVSIGLLAHGVHLLFTAILNRVSVHFPE